MNDQEFDSILRSGAPVHLTGIGGVSMRALARMLKNLEVNVRGSDRDESIYTGYLREEGIPVTIGHRAENTAGAALVIRTAAVPDDNPEIAAARVRGTPVIERAEAWGLLMKRFEAAVCIAGTHGKTTTTSMIATFTAAAGLDPTVMVGGDLPSIGGTLRIGHSGLIVAESCEYKNSFLHFHPTVAIILNIDRDHLDFFKDMDDIMHSFRSFAERTPAHGCVVANGDDINTRTALAGIDRRVIWFGTAEDCDVRPAHITDEGGCYGCDVMIGGVLYAGIRLSVPGRHNLQNALAAAAVARELGVPAEQFATGITDYRGVGRRFEFKKRWHDAVVYDDYAHHPGEIEASLRAAREVTAGRVICVFQPHTYSRTAALLPDFAAALHHADLCILCPIYAAREKNDWNVSAADLQSHIPGALLARDLSDAAQILADVVRPGDLIFTMGAGDVYRVADDLIEEE